MNTRKNMDAHHGTTERAIAFARRIGIIDTSSEDEERKVLDSVRQLMAMGLSTEEIEDLDIRQPMLQAICEYAQFDADGSDESERAIVAVEATLKVIADEIQRLDLELEMLNLRKRALMRRVQVLRKIEFTMQAEDEGLLAA